MLSHWGVLAGLASEKFCPGGTEQGRSRVFGYPSGGKRSAECALEDGWTKVRWKDRGFASRDRTSEKISVDLWKKSSIIII